jgi:hypothetical protein
MHARSDAQPSTDGRQGVPGWRVVLAFLAIACGIAVTVIVVGVIAIRSSVDEGGDPMSRAETAARATVEDYVAALNDRDAERLLPLLTDAGLRAQLRVASAAELPPRLAALTAADRIDELRVTSVRVSGRRAVVTTRFQWRDQDQEAAYRLVLVDGRWLIDG